MLVNYVSRQVFRHEVCWVLGAQDLDVLSALAILDILDPRGTNIHVPQFARTLALRDGQGRGRVRVQRCRCLLTPIAKHRLDARWVHLTRAISSASAELRVTWL